MQGPGTATAPLFVGRYELHDEIARGGAATVHLGRLRGASSFARTVAIKRLHAHYANDPDVSARFLDEARLAARVRHPNVASIVDVVARGDERFLVMEYVHGESLAALLARARRDDVTPDPAVACAIVVGALRGLHAAHEATTEANAPLHLVHRDVSPQNILVGAEGIARMIDFGVAKGVGRAHETRNREVRGTLAYMAPEQLRGEAVDRRADVYAAGIVLWELLTGRPLFGGASDAETIANAMGKKPGPPSAERASVSPAVDAVVLRALQRDPARRFATANDFASALEASITCASASRVAEWVEAAGGDLLRLRAEKVRAVEAASAWTPRAPRVRRALVGGCGAALVVAALVARSGWGSAALATPRLAPRSAASAEATPIAPGPTAALAEPAPVVSAAPVAQVAENERANPGSAPARAAPASVRPSGAVDRVPQRRGVDPGSYQ